MQMPVEQLDNSQAVVLPHGLRRPIRRVDVYPDPAGGAWYVVVYADSTLNAWENRAADKGRWSQSTVDGLEKSLRTMRTGELVEVTV